MQKQQQISLNIPLDFNQLIDIVRQLPPEEKLVLSEVLLEKQEVVIPEEHKTIVRQRIKASEQDPSRLLKWDDVKQNLKL